MKNTPDIPVVELVPLADIKPNPYQPRVHDKAKIRDLARTIETTDVTTPVFIDRENIPFSGAARIAAYRLLGRDLIPAIRITHISTADAKGKAFTLADNRHGERASWNDQLLGQVLLDLTTEDLNFSIEVTGFSVGEIDLKIEALQSGTAEDEPAIAMTGPAVTKLGQFWKCQEHVIGCADALEPATYEQLMAGKKAAMVVADAPYNVAIQGNVSGKGRNHHREFVMGSGEMTPSQFDTFLGSVMSVVARHTSKGALGYWFMDWRHISQLQAAGEAVFGAPLNICVWAKDRAGMGSFYRSAHEMIMVFRTKGGRHRNNVQLGRFGRDRSNLWSYPAPNNLGGGGEDGALAAEHPTPKPVSLIADAILDATAPRDHVLDPFLGSGTTLLACQQTRRFCRAIDLDPLYVDLAVRRWRLLTGEDAICAETGRTFTECEQDVGGPHV